MNITVLNQNSINSILDDVDKYPVINLEKLHLNYRFFKEGISKTFRATMELNKENMNSTLNFILKSMCEIDLEWEC